MSILFISDVHLCNTKPSIVDGFLKFLQYQASRSSSLYILGDLFDTWLGDDDDNILYIKIAKNLKLLNSKKISCYFIHGNHDFLLSLKYASSCGMKLLSNQHIIKLPSGKNVVIMHGDSLCVYNKLFQFFRKFLYHYTLQKVFLFLPLYIRTCIFNVIYKYCKKNQKFDSKTQFSINKKTILDILINNQSEIIIHGHIHQSIIYNIQYSKKVTFKHIILGNWSDYGSVVEIDENNNHCTLIKFPLITKQNYKPAI